MCALRTARICTNGHKYYKSSNCSICPICENHKVVEQEFLTKISAPARRALERENILTLEKLSSYSEREILCLHGIGPTAIRKLLEALKSMGLKFKND